MRVEIKPLTGALPKMGPPQKRQNRGFEWAGVARVVIEECCWSLSSVWNGREPIHTR